MRDTIEWIQKRKRGNIFQFVKALIDSRRLIVIIRNTLTKKNDHEDRFYCTDIVINCPYLCT